MDSIVAKWRNIPVQVKYGVLGSILMYASVAGFVTSSRDLLASDTTNHLDYIYRLYNGDIPRRADEITYPAFVEILEKRAPGQYHPQASAANPPLFYVIQLPFVGPLLEEGRYKAAAIIGKYMNILIASVALIAIAYAAWLFGGKNRHLMSVAVPAIAGGFFWFTLLTLVYGGVDALLILLGTLSIIIMRQLIVIGPRKRYIALLTMVSIAGMLTKAPYVIFLGTSCFALLYSLFKADLVSGKLQVKRVPKRFLILAAYVLVVAIASLWFYYFWNYTAYGNWVSAREPWYTGGRVSKTAEDVLLSWRLWGLWVNSYSGIVWVSYGLVAATILGLVIRPFSYLKSKLSGYDNKALAVILVLPVLGVFATQIEHAIGIGEYYFRYMLPAMFVFALVFAYGLLGFKKARGQVVAFFAITLGASTLLIRTELDINTMYSHAEKIAGLPSIVVPILLAMFLSGSFLVAHSLYKLSRTYRPD